MMKNFKNYVWMLGILGGFVAAFIYLSMANVEADDGVVYLEFDHSTPVDDERIKEILEILDAKENIGEDVVFVPKHPVTVLPGEERRKLDEQRAEREQKEMEATIEARVDEFPTPTPLPCETGTELIENQPLIFVLCGGDVVGIPSATSYIPANNLQEADALLRAYVLELLGGLSSSGKRAGYYSPFSDISVLNTLTLDANGHVSIDFNGTFKSKLGHLHHSGAYLMMDQLYNTVFQFREVNSLAITLDGSCEKFADLFELICINTERDRWQLRLDSNNHDEVRLSSLTRRR